jgi:hypothetical protein
MTRTKFALAGLLLLGSASVGLAQSEFAPKPQDRPPDTHRGVIYNNWSNDQAVFSTRTTRAPRMMDRTTTAPSHGP